MGNIDSKYKFEHGNIYCQTDKAYFVAGEHITGKIYLNLSMSYPAQSLEIEVKGKEKCKWKTQQSKEVKNGEDTKSELVDVTHKNERSVITYKVPIYYFPGGMAPAGQYTFPFSFALPSNLPASMFYCGVDKSAAKIKYKLQAYLEPSMGFSVKKMKFKQILVIRQPTIESGFSPTQTDTRNVYACCCFGNKGQAVLTTQFEKDAYTPNEICRAMADINNSECGAEINNINIRLEQHIELRASDGRVYNDRRILEQKDFDGLAANQSTGGLNRYLELNLASIKQQARSFTDGKSIGKDDLFLAEQLQPTARGAIVKLHYTLTVQCNYGTCCAEQPHCTIPLCITPPPLPSYGQIEAPSGWNPTVFQTFNFSLPGPGEVIAAAAAQTVAPISGNMNFNVGREEVKFNAPTMNLQIDTDKINNEVPIPMPVPTMEVRVDSNEGHHYGENVNMNVNMGGVPMMPGMNMNVESHNSHDSTGEQVNMNVNFGGAPMMAGMNMQVDNDVKATTSYSHESTVGGTTTRSAYATSHDNVPVPVPVPAPVPAAGPANAEVSMNIGMGMDMNMNVNVDANGENANVQMNMGMPGMDSNFNADAED